MSLPGSRDSGVGIPSIFSLFPPAKSSSGSTSLSNGDLPVPNFSPSISSFFPPNNSPSCSESAPVKQSSPSISLLFPPTHSQSNSLSSTRAIHELPNSICSIFRPNCSYSSSSESSHDQVTSKRKKMDHELEDVASSYFETQLIKAREHQQQQQQQQQQPQQPQHQQQQHGFTFNEVNSVRASTSKVVCCHFSSDGKLLASGGHDKKAVLWSTDSLKPETTLKEHSALITDVRFSPCMSRLATSSFDKTVRVWNAYNPGYSLRTFTGHSSTVMSLDFHPNNNDLICSCDGDGEIRYWSIKNGSCQRVFKGGTAQTRFQPRFGRYLAAAAENVVSIVDVETQACRRTLQGHTNPIYYLCWDPSGEFLASVSEDSVRLWALGSGSEGECVHELSYDGNKFRSCVFHHTYTSLLVIGCDQSLKLWNMAENKIMDLPAHDGPIAALAVSAVTGLIASASHDKLVKLWK